MRYLNVPCVQCEKLFTETDDVVCCPTCGSPHHRACWKEHGCCANAHLHEQGFAWKAPVSEKEEPEKPVAVQMFSADTQANHELPTVECPFCGAQNYANELYCAVCHEPIHQNASADAGEPLQDEEQREKMYADFRTYGGLDPKSRVGEITVEEYSAYLKNNPGSYIRRFVSLEAYKKTMSWNWPAFWLTAVSMFSSVVLGPVWFFYRKMNKVGTIFLAALLAFGVATAFVYASDPAYAQMTERTQELYTDYLQQAQAENTDMMQLLEDFQLNLLATSEAYAENCSQLTYAWSMAADLLYSYLLPVLVGLFATVLYFKKAKSEILSIRSQYGDREDYRDRLSQKGGVSVAGAVLAAVLCFVIFIIQQYLPIILLTVGVF
ncbi:MAG: hypothetical protein IJC45_02475 [Clostridia bacterium]|nr:hypothetical protein [Clostridia bacterium]